MKRIIFSVLLVLGGVGFAAFADLRPASIFTDNMVLQREMKVPVWGVAGKDEKVTVEFAGQTVTARADRSGNWRVDLAPLETSAMPGTLVISGRGSSVTLTNVLVGEVWLCSGQSNMDFTMWMLKQPEEEIQAATNYPFLRLFRVKNQASPQEQKMQVEGSWTTSCYETAGAFSGVATYFGRALCRDLGVPVGLIHSAVSGTPAESWTSRGTLEQLPFMEERLSSADNSRKNYSPEKAAVEFERALAEWQKKTDAGEEAGRRPRLWNPFTSQWQPASLYNGMIAPLIPCAIRGAIWYQGESNAKRHAQYHELFSAMIRGWRTEWNQGDFPFLFVQLANFMTVQTNAVETADLWPHIREAQLQTLTEPDTAMAVITDVGEADNIHPRDKKTVGERLALAARVKAYGEDLVFSGPLFQRLEIQGREAILRFDHVGGGLMFCDGQGAGFAIAGDDQVWHWADARIEGDRVVVYSPEVNKPVAVRYNWADNPIGSLCNKEGLPASLFRTDSWQPVVSIP